MRRTREEVEKVRVEEARSGIPHGGIVAGEVIPRGNGGDQVMRHKHVKYVACESMVTMSKVRCLLILLEENTIK